MMSNDIRARLTGVHAIGRVGGGGRGGAAATLGTLAGRVAGQIADALDMAGRDGDPQGGGGGHAGVLPADLYGVDREAEALAGGLGASPADTVRLAAALHAFTEECAAELAARPAAFTVERIAGIVTRVAGSAPTVPETLAAIEQATRAIGRDR